VRRCDGGLNSFNDVGGQNLSLFFFWKHSILGDARKPSYLPFIPRRVRFQRTRTRTKADPNGIETNSAVSSVRAMEMDKAIGDE
jgi:hypothetical protein